MTEIIETQTDSKSSSFLENKKHMQSLVDQWRSRVDQVKLGGGEDAQKKT